MTAVLLATWLLVVVDQIDGDTALLEWAPHVFGTVPRDVLPAEVREGDRLEVRLAAQDLCVTGADHGEVHLSARVRRTRFVESNPTAARRPTPGE